MVPIPRILFHKLGKTVSPHSFTQSVVMDLHSLTLCLQTMCPDGFKVSPWIYIVCSLSSNMSPWFHTVCPHGFTQCVPMVSKCPHGFTQCVPMVSKCPHGFTQCVPMVSHRMYRIFNGNLTL